MGLINLARNLRNLARTNVSFSSSDVAAMRANSGSIADSLAVPGSARPAENVILAFACIQTRREAIGGREPLLTDSQDNVIESGPAYELLHRPNAEDDWDAYVRELETYNTLYNTVAIHLTRDPIRPELEPLHPAGLKTKMGYYAPTGTPRLAGWEYQDPTTGERREFPVEDVVARVGFNPHAPLSALSPLQVLQRTMKGDLAAREQNLGLFANDATPRGYLSTEQGATKEQMESVLDVWNSTQQGFLNRHKTAALWGGVKYEKVQLTPQELEFLESLKQMRIDYYMVFRVYPAMLAEMTGETGLSQGSSTDSQRVAWWEDVGVPELNLLAGMHTEAFQRLGLTGGGATRRLSRTARVANRAPSGITCWYNEAAIPALARQRLSKADTFTKFLSAGYQPDETNDFLDLGLPPHPDNLGRVAFSLQTIGQEAVPAPTPKPETRSETARACEDALARLESAIEENLARADQRKKARDVLLGKAETQAAKAWSGFFVKQRGRVLARIREDLARADGEKPFAGDPDEAMGKIFPRTAEDEALVARMQSLWLANLDLGRKLFAEKTGVTPNALTVEDPRVMNAVEARRIQGLKVNDTTEEKLRGIFRDGLENGATLADLEDGIAEYYNTNCVGESSARPKTAARTQVAGIVNDGELMAAQDVGGLKKYWIHGSPDEPRPEHVEAARTYDAAHAIGLDEEFVVGGERMSAPGDANADVGQTANCTCGVGFVKG